MKTKIQIKNRWFGNILFEYEKENNNIKDTLLEGIKSGANLSGANLSDAYLGGADLSGANLSDVDLSGANLSDVDLSGANLSDVDLSGANLRGANLSGANLSDVDLRGANLSDADLSDANLSDANLSGAYICASDGEINEKEIIANFENNKNIKIIESYINHDIFPSRWNFFWRNGLIIRKWKVIEKEVKEMTMEEVNKALGYEVKIVEKRGNEE